MGVRSRFRYMVSMSARLLFCLALCVACDCADKNLCPEPFVEGTFECECPPEWVLEDGWCILPDGGRVPIPGVDAAVDSGADASVAIDASVEEDAAADAGEMDAGTDAGAAGADAGEVLDASLEDAGTDAGIDAGPECYSDPGEYPAGTYCNPMEPVDAHCPAVCPGTDSFRVFCSPDGLPDEGVCGVQLL